MLAGPDVSPSTLLAPSQYLDVLSSLKLSSAMRHCPMRQNDQFSGIFYMLGMMSGRTYWLNPLSVRGSNTLLSMNTSQLATTNIFNIASYGNYTYDTDIRAKAGLTSVEFTFILHNNYTILATDILLRNGRANGNAFTEWMVEGSSDGVNFDVLYVGKESSPWIFWHTIHNVSLANSGVVKFCSHFRFWFNAAAVSLSGIELYGFLNKQ